jgi:hypothetical protein
MDEYLAFQEKKTDIKQTQQLANNKPTKKQEIVAVVKESKPKNIPVTAPKPIEVKQEKPIETVVEKPAEKPAEKIADKPVEKVVDTTKKVTESPKQPEQKVQPAPTVIPVQPKVDDVPLFKNLFAYRANEPHFVAIYIVSGTFNFEKTKAAIEAYNAQNYAVMNLKVTLETFDKQQIIIIGSLSDAQVGKSYLLRMVKEKGLFDGMKGSVYRNLLGSQKNLNTVMQQNALSTYFEFMQEYYLK